MPNTRPAGYWKDFSNLEREIMEFVSSSDHPDLMPTDGDLRQNGRSDLAKAVRHHGGLKAVAEALGLKCKSNAKPPNYWSNPSMLSSELIEFSKAQGSPGIMPTLEQLRDARRFDLKSAIRRNGGVDRVAKIAGLAYERSTKKSGYWTKFEVLERELLAYLNTTDEANKMPTLKELNANDRADLVHAILKHGGVSGTTLKIYAEN